MFSTSSWRRRRQVCVFSFCPSACFFFFTQARTCCRAFHLISPCSHEKTWTIFFRSVTLCCLQPPPSIFACWYFYNPCMFVVRKRCRQHFSLAPTVLFRYSQTMPSRPMSMEKSFMTYISTYLNTAIVRSLKIAGAKRISAIPTHTVSCNFCRLPRFHNFLNLIKNIGL